MQLTTIAKPYANAIFAIAEQDKSHNNWRDILQAGTQLAENKDFQGFMDSQTNKDNKLNMPLGLLALILGRVLSDKERIFVNLLVTNGRINTLPSIYDLFAAISNSSSDIQLFTVVSAYRLSEKEQQQIISDLSVKYNATIRITTEIDENLVGGVVIKQGDRVIDLSIQARVSALGLRLSVAH